MRPENITRFLRLAITAANPGRAPGHQASFERPTFSLCYRRGR